MGIIKRFGTTSQVEPMCKNSSSGPLTGTLFIDVQAYGKQHLWTAPNSYGHSQVHWTLCFTDLIKCSSFTFVILNQELMENNVAVTTKAHGSQMAGFYSSIKSCFVCNTGWKEYVYIAAAQVCRLTGE